MKTYSFKQLFDYAGREYEVLWAECYKIFIKSGVLKYEGTTTLYYDDILDSLRDNDIWADASSEPIRIIKSFMDEETITRDIKISHK
jgi:hypothetical protein